MLIESIILSTHGYQTAINAMLIASASSFDTYRK